MFTDLFDPSQPAFMRGLFVSVFVVSMASLLIGCFAGCIFVSIASVLTPPFCLLLLLMMGMFLALGGAALWVKIERVFDHVKRPWRFFDHKKASAFPIEKETPLVEEDKLPFTPFQPSASNELNETEKTSVTSSPHVEIGIAVAFKWQSASQKATTSPNPYQMACDHSSTLHAIDQSTYHPQ